MKAAKYLFALWAGVLVYASLAFLFGAMGISAYNQLEKEQKKQEVNIENLQLINHELGNTVNSLLYDKDTLTIYAREQGYASAKEHFIRIVGLGGRRNTRNSAGDITVAADPQYVPDRTLRIIASCTAISLLICMAAFDLMKSLREH